MCVSYPAVKKLRGKIFTAVSNVQCGPLLVAEQFLDSRSRKLLGCTTTHSGHYRKSCMPIDHHMPAYAACYCVMATDLRELN